jgi:hypothetical protein
MRSKAVQTDPATHLGAPLQASNLACGLNGINFPEHTPQFLSREQGGLDILIVRSLLKKYDNFTIGTLPRIAALDSTRPVSEIAATFRTSNLD